MRGVTNSLAALLSLLMVSTTMFTATCDLTCWLRYAHSDCHGTGAAESQAMSTSTPSEMDMGPGMNMNSDGSESAMGPGQPTKPDHLMSQAEMVMDRAEQATEPETGTRAAPGPLKNLSSCTHGAGDQILVSASPQRGDHSLPDAPGWIAAGVVRPVCLSADVRRIGFDPAPLKTLEADRLATILRI